MASSPRSEASGLFTKNGTTARKFVGTLIFPTLLATLATVLNYYLFGAYCSIAVTQVDNLPFIQIASLLGQSAITFLIGWFASSVYFVCEYVIENKHKENFSIWNDLKKPICIVLSIYLGLFIYGGIRLSVISPSGNMVKVAMANGPKQEYVNGRWETGTYDEKVTWVSNAIKKAAAGEAKILVFNEEAFYLPKDEEEPFRKIVSDEAKNNNIYVLVGTEVGSRITGNPIENKITFYNDKGDCLFDYLKSYLVPILEDTIYKEGNFDIPIVNIPLAEGEESEVSAAISYEGDFNQYINKLGSHPDIHMNPSVGWEGVGSAARSSLQLRAIEHGMSVIMPTTSNTSAIYDYLGHVVVNANPDECGYNAVNFAYIPTQGTETVYGFIGPAIDWIYLGGLIVFIVLAISRGRKLKGVVDQRSLLSEVDNDGIEENENEVQSDASSENQSKTHSESKSESNAKSEPESESSSEPETKSETSAKSVTE